MLSLALLTTLSFILAATVVLCAVATRDSALIPATVNPFGPGAMPASSADTLPDATYATATLTGDWNVAEAQSLHHVEDILDWLENHNVRHTELQNQNGKLIVRWR
ncbi:hypothetical protein [Limnoglobus roseus]|uniref:Uncharacterized protein n=1 Tax=Limnoglobus roseus TaxID=2598579 RepID=A0A5C1AFF0_9BACT|nr:hypothetical protein [Limnoglobus roseus]QEL17981.1 hypothetical protein PX52LOC_04995 [Limnoglobus roseus]